MSMNRPDPDTDTKVRLAIRNLNETIQQNAHEPSLAFYRIQEHVQRALPTMVHKRYELENLQERMNGLVFDIEYGMEAVKDLGSSEEHLVNIKTSLEKAVQVGKQINILRQRQIHQQFFEKKDGSVLASLKS